MARVCIGLGISPVEYRQLTAEEVYVLLEELQR
jgi:hypothetical protein